ncbi:Uncharacterised protein [Mycobacteroides abscessus subsp. bolletii]|nr:Uncharacterised protein [Mycobacteroides abscessus subsp. bolletii]SHS27699.1 Uncharacterised protein [Mycobacteroides abscessus subsp. bolletii]SHS78249.1 Uncharacterised protein [Mycobacteroides abscessus subsp. bolletii]SKF64906.1 Uncharacterised protein [Mycobacteroides abscessus subsp. bolletii]SKG37478.1 Uncharacterised protein [Mycobacteroides abscessus subsp. bolletii]
MGMASLGDTVGDKHQEPSAGEVVDGELVLAWSAVVAVQMTSN